jgi:hypothetical protein
MELEEQSDEIPRSGKEEKENRIYVPAQRVADYARMKGQQRLTIERSFYFSLVAAHYSHHIGRLSLSNCCSGILVIKIIFCFEN